MKNKKGSFKLVAYEKIKQDILNFVYRPKDRLIESQIASSLKISKTPVREALLLLEREGLVTIVPNSGFFVCELSFKEAEDCFELRRLIESYAIKRIIQNITEEEIKLIKQNLEETARYTNGQDIEKTIQLETEFHNILYEATKSKKIFSILSTLQDQLHIYRSIASRTKGGTRVSFEEHMKIIEAIEKRDELKAKFLVRRHIDHAKKRALKKELFIE
jgi:DNA-binding GntR family transcriptional regulator